MASLCPSCGENSAAREKLSPFPFCSARCRAVDLSKWLDGDYRFGARFDLGGYEFDESTIEILKQAHAPEVQS